VLAGETQLLYVVVASVPFLFARLAYAVLTAFDKNSKFFNTTSNATSAIIVEAVMSLGSEFVIVALYLIGGWKAEKTQAQQSELKQYYSTS